MHTSSFTFLILICFALPFCSSTGPLACWSPFHISYVFRFRFHSCSAFTTQHRPSAPFPLPISYHSPFLFPHWFSDVVAYPEPYLEFWFSLCSVLYKVTWPLVCSLASSTQSSLVSSLPRFALRPIHSKPSLTWNGSLRTLQLFVRSSLGFYNSTRTISGRRLLKDTPCMLEITE